MIEKKFCNKCETLKDLNDFYKQKGNKYNKRSECKECTRKRNKNVYNDPLKREKKLHINKKHIEENQEYYRNYHKEYYIKNKNNFSIRSCKTYSSVDGRAKSLYSSAKRRSIKHNLEFDLSFSKIVVTLMLGKCERTGITFDLSPASKTWRNPYAPSLDRINSNKGYTNDNVKVVVNMYNTGKGQHTDEEFIKFCHIVAKANPI